MEILMSKGVVGRLAYYDKLYYVVSKDHNLDLVLEKQLLTNGTHIEGGYVINHEPLYVDGYFLYLGSKYFFIFEKEVDKAEEVK